MDLWRKLDDSRMIAHALANLGEVKHHQGDLVGAEKLYQESLALFRDLGDRRGTAFVLYQLGRVSLIRHDANEAAARFNESLVLRQHVGETAAVIETLEGLAGAACVRGDPALGVRIFAATEALRLAIDAPLAASYSEERDRFLAQARGSVGEAMFAQEWNRGGTLSLDQAVAEAMTGVHAIAMCSPDSGSRLSWP
jgi:hypothetical protein